MDHAPRKLEQEDNLDAFIGKIAKQVRHKPVNAALTIADSKRVREQVA